MPNGIILYNPTAGRYPTRFLVERAARVLRKRNWRIDVAATQSGSHLVELANRAAADRLDAVFVAGGDGSVGMAVSALAGSDTALGVFPVGTANALAHDLGLPTFSLFHPTALDACARSLSAIQPSRVDVGICSGRPFLMWAGVGLDAYLVHQMEPRARWVKYFASLQYAATAFRNVAYWGGMKLDVQVDGKDISGRFLLAVVNNIRSYVGGLAKLSTSSYLDDGKMDLWLFSGETLWDALIHFRDLLLGRHLYSDQAMCIHFRQLTIQSDNPIYMQMDGEPVELQSQRAEIRVQPAALKVLVPSKTPMPLFLYRRAMQSGPGD